MSAQRPRRDFAAELAAWPCWDQHTQAVFEERGEALVDRVLQNRGELIALCELIEHLELRSYLEIGAWTGALTRCLHSLFHFERLAVCDDGWAEQRGLELRLPPDAALFRGDSGSEAYTRWRGSLGLVDLVFIDANHAYHAVKRDFERAVAAPHRVIALHDITGANRHTTGVRRLWEEIDHGWKHEILRPQRELGLPHSVMGIGIWSREPLHLPARG